MELQLHLTFHQLPITVAAGQGANAPQRKTYCLTEVRLFFIATKISAFFQ